MSKRSCCTLVVTLTLLAGCACPPTSASSSGRASGRDPSGGTFAFLGGLRCFFGSDENTSKDETRRVNDADLTNKPKAEETDHAASLTIR